MTSTLGRASSKQHCASGTLMRRRDKNGQGMKNGTNLNVVLSI